MTPLPALENLRLAVIGLGYVGLPLAVEFAKTRAVLGFDVSAARIAALQLGEDATKEVPAADLAAARYLNVSDDPADLKDCSCYIVAVPTPIDAGKRPDLTPLTRATETVGLVLKPGDIVIFESTVYPGMTEEVCVPLLESASGLTLNSDFWVGYSPERINPGDATHRLPSICKVTSGSTPAAADLIDALYGQIITAGTYKAESIRVAEAAKVIENTQRDLNIALINELAMLFNTLRIDTEAVLRAAGTKWNFLPFRPGLVGGHCIGVDPYYLTHKAQEAGYHPEIILAGRRINDRMGAYVATELVKAMTRKGISLPEARVLVMGITFKENCPDVRNSKVVDVIAALRDYGITPDVTDPCADPEETKRQHGITLTTDIQPGTYDAVLLAVPHSAFVTLSADRVRAFGKSPHVFFDMKSSFPEQDSDLRL